MIRLGTRAFAVAAWFSGLLAACSDLNHVSSEDPPGGSTGGVGVVPGESGGSGGQAPPIPPDSAGTSSTGSGGVAGGTPTDSGGNAPLVGGSSTGGLGTGGFGQGGSQSTGSGGSSKGGSSTGGNPTATGGSPSGCDGGPLDQPIPDCAPEPAPDTGDYHADCVARINQLRWECQCLPPLERWTEGEDCANQHAEYDYGQDEAHAGFSGRICENSGNAQNECPDYGPNFGIVEFCLQQMWDEGPGEPYSAHGHYINMTNPDYGRVACGIYETPEGNFWAVQNFTR